MQETGDITPDRLLLIVVGSGLEAEIEDRPLAHALAGRCCAALDDAVDGPAGTMRAVVCTDLWYLNESSVRTVPALSVGGPQRNALTAHLTAQLAGQLPRRFGVEGQWVIQTPDDADDLVVLMWGQTEDQTRCAVRTFAEEMLEAFVGACVVRASRMTL